MSDSNAYRLGAISVALGEDMRQDLRDLKSVTGVSETEIIRRALREYARQRVRYVKPMSAAGCRLIERYITKEETK